MPVPVVLEQDEAEYQALLARLDQEYPPIGKGLDLQKIQGNIGERTTKAIVLHLSLSGWSITRLTALLNESLLPEEPKITPRMVGRFLADAMREACPIENLEALRSFELQKLDRQAQWLWEQAERSCEDEVTEVSTWEVSDEEGHTMEVPEGTEGATRVIKRTVKGQAGNPAYQKALIEIAKHRDKLLGLAQPTRVEIDKKERVLKVTQVVVNTREEAEAARAAGLLK